MGFVVLDTDVLTGASPKAHRQAREGWRLLQCLVKGPHILLVSPGLWQEYRQISANSMSRGKLSRYAFTKIEMASEPQDRDAWERLKQLGVDEKDIGWVLLAAKHGAIFVTREKYAPRRRKSEHREQEHQRIVRAVEGEFDVHIWHPDYAFRRLCSKSKGK
jgi:predicted nucleic acid-binding protein